MHTLSWVKGHGTENDFLLVHDPDAEAYSWLDAEAVRLVCDRRRGVGADGLLRVVRADALADGRAITAARGGDAAAPVWMMDFRNADGSVGEMCGNGVRVFARYLAETGLIDPTNDVSIVTRAGVKDVRFADDRLSVDMGVAGFPPCDGLKVGTAARSWPGTAVDMGNPHAVVYVDDLAEPGPLVEPPVWSPAEVFPEGVNVEFAVRRGERHLAMRVHERGVGETRSCGTGACAVAAVTARIDGVPAPWTYQIDVSGGRLEITGRADGHLEMTGPAVLTARGTVAL